MSFQNPDFQRTVNKPAEFPLYQSRIPKLRQTANQQLKIAKKYLSLIKRNVSVGSLAYTYVANAQTEIKELDK